MAAEQWPIRKDLWTMSDYRSKTGSAPVIKDLGRLVRLMIEAEVPDAVIRTAIRRNIRPHLGLEEAKRRAQESLN